MSFGLKCHYSYQVELRIAIYTSFIIGWNIDIADALMLTLGRGQIVKKVLIRLPYGAWTSWLPITKVYYYNIYRLFECILHDEP